MIKAASGQVVGTHYVRFEGLVERGYVRNRTTLKRWIEQGLFPKPIKLGPNSIAWAEEDLQKFDASRAADRGKAA